MLIKAINVLTCIQIKELKLDKIGLCVRDSLESENLTNPKFYKRGMNTLNYTFLCLHNLTDQTFSNINAINPSITRFYNTIKRGKYDFMRIINMIKGWTNLEFSMSEKDWLLNFKNAFIMITSALQNPMFIKWNSICLNVRIQRYKFKDYWLSKWESTDSLYHGQSYLHLIDSLQFKLQNYSLVLDDEEIKQLSEEFSEYLSDWNFMWEFIIPMRYLESVFISDTQAKEIKDNENWYVFANEISKAKSISCSLNFVTKSEL